MLLSPAEPAGLIVKDGTNGSLMAKTDAFLPTPTARRVIFVVFGGFQLLDLSGPLSVLSMANWLADAEAYTLITASLPGGLVESSATLQVETVALKTLSPGPRDTIIVVGGREPHLSAACGDPTLKEWLAAADQVVERLGSVCTGSFALAEAGVLSGRRAATHWDAIAPFRERFPQVQLDTEAVYVVDGPYWTSAGVTCGIDLCLALVGQDLGPEIMARAAKRLVVHMRRPGDAPQLSPVLDAQTRGGDRFAGVLAWIDARLHKPIRVEDMAEAARQTERTFHRRFVKAFGVTPAKYLEQARLTRARQLLEMGASVKEAAPAVGFRSQAGFRAAYEARFGVAPSAHRRKPSAE